MPADITALQEITKALVAPGKGILAADESLPTIEKRFKALGVESTEEERRAYRELLFTTPEIEKYISGIIMFDETLRLASLAQGKPAAKILEERGIIPGIKVDMGKVDFPGFPNEEFTQGLDGLGKRLEEYVGLGAQFAKWRVVIAISESSPTRPVLEANMTGLAIYAGFCQQAGLVPIVEPEVLMDGNHDIAKCAGVTKQMLEILFKKFFEYKIVPEASLLKVNMILPGKDSAQKASPEEVAKQTLETLKSAVSVAIPGIVFLSGGQSPLEATANLDAINKLASSVPWQLSFSYGRALQEPALVAWAGKVENVAFAQKKFLKRAKMNSVARDGKWEERMENERD
ncbi:fructose-bisphosphate aldolase [Candidatus Woesebacteria bacterium RIFCSPHIGHO2_01_FULL_44_10]|uniref:Probable fructose-bisphosphate aldolase class 1 n=1 Tax=Candidatus Woesebacteria bacterium RIFCSPLOWO2_01_FULL_44_14 TaxID=1802525 RepID=A0A1F8C016_9BACT|nr:MAG: fructose-bisphosphate aldolase [Candidatus Woesebacteria bacterium RIFCSPHIGHO2_01_FULL_44_10]OGM69676.1 MAG: fructose-bisphosphate aldolase [Candidatus Woesebacteria bacterium RIFCSPLOWO2_01_FULL_44_14]